MSRFPRKTINQVVFNNVALNVGITSSPIDIREINYYTVQISWINSTGTSGQLIVEASTQMTDTKTWVSINSTNITTGTNSARFSVSGDGTIHSFIRIRYNLTTGTTGTLKVVFNGKK